MKILLVEDDTALRHALEELLNRENYDVVSAACAADALAKMRAAIDLVMLDVTLPDGDGVSLCKAWRSQGSQTLILFLTAKDEELDKGKLQASRKGEALTLTLTEYEILTKRMAEHGIVTRAALLDALWDVDSRFVDDNTLSVHVSRLREKVGAAHIKTIRGVGYQWAD